MHFGEHTCSISSLKYRWTKLFGCVFLCVQCPTVHSKCYHCVLSPVDFDVCYLIVGTLSLDIYTYIICPVAMPRIVELLHTVEEKCKISEINMDISVSSSFSKYKSQIQQMMIPSLLFTFLHIGQDLTMCPFAA